MVQNSKGTKEYGKSPSHPILRPQVISPQRQRVFCFLFILPEMIMDGDPGAAGHLPQGILSQAGVGAMVLWQGILDVELSHASLAGGVSVLDGLSIQQPSDLGHWSSPYGALQHKILALNDGAVLQDTGEGGATSITASLSTWRVQLQDTWPRALEAVQLYVPLSLVRALSRQR